MTEQVILIKTPISREDLDCVVVGLEMACGGKRIQVSDAFELSVDDERQAIALKALFNQNGNAKDTSVKHAGGRPKKSSKGDPDQLINVSNIEHVQVAEVDEPIRQHRSRNDVRYTILSGHNAGKEFTGASVGVMLKAGKMAAGTRVSHPVRGQLIVVTNGAGIFTLQAVPA